METLTIKHGDKHDVKLNIVNAPLNLAGGNAQIFVTPSVGGPTTTFSASLNAAGDVLTWALDGTLLVGKYKLEAQVTVSGFVVTAPSDGWVELTVLQDLA